MRLPNRTVGAFAVASIVAASVSVSAQPPAGGPGPVLGIVEVPRLFVYDSFSGSLTTPKGAVVLRARPAIDSAIAATIASPDALERREYNYDAVGAVVYGRDDGWSLLRTKGKISGWLAPEEAGPFHSLETLVRQGLTFLTDAWDGFVSVSPGAGDRIRTPLDPLRRVIGYLVPQLETMRVALKPGEDPERVRDRYTASAMSSRRAPDGSFILDLETGTKVPVFGRPEKGAPVVANVQTNFSDATLQTLHRIPHEVVVSDRRPGWFQVSRAGESIREATRVWVEDTPAWRFHPVSNEDEERELADLSWGRESRSVRVIGTRTVADRLWLEIETLTHSICDLPDEPPTVRARGWVPAHDASGAPTVWFYSRGC